MLFLKKVLKIALEVLIILEIIEIEKKENLCSQN